MSTLTAKTVIDLARARHAAFSERSVTDGAALTYLEARQRTLLLMYGGAIDGLVSTSIQVASVISGLLVGSANGAPVYLTTFQDGWATHVDTNGVPYWNFSEPSIAGDPFGQNGGTPGFPLPSDFLKLVKATVVWQDNRIGPLDIVQEPSRLERRRLAVPTAFLNGNRLVPIRDYADAPDNATDIWASGIQSVQLSYVASPALANLSDTITLPAPLLEAAIAGLAEYMAGAAGMGAGDRQSFALIARQSEQALNDYGDDVTGYAVTNAVRYRG